LSNYKYYSYNICKKQKEFKQTKQKGNYMIPVSPISKEKRAFIIKGLQTHLKPRPLAPKTTNDDVNVPSKLFSTAIVYALMTQKKPAKQLTGPDVKVVDVTDEKEANLSASREEKPAIKTLVIDEEIDVPTETSSLSESDKSAAKKQTSYNPFANETDVARTSYNPFDNMVDVSRKETSASKDESASREEERSILEERTAPKKEGLDWDSNWTSGSGDLTVKPTYSESLSNVFRTLTQRKVLIVSGSALTALGIGGAAAYFFNPVTTAAHAAAAFKIGSAAAMSANLVLIQPGYANTMLIADVLMKVAVMPTAQITGAVVLPMLSTAIMTTLGAFLLLYVGNKVWEATKVAVWGAGSAVVNKFGEELDKTYAGQAVKFAIKTTASPYLALMEPTDATRSDVESSEETSEEEVQPKLQIDGSTEGDDVIAEEEARIKAQKKAQSSFPVKVLKAGLMTAGLGAGAYFVYKCMPDFGK
jgi:hypothetical protein